MLSASGEAACRAVRRPFGDGGVMVADAGICMDELEERGGFFLGGRFVVESGFRGRAAEDGVCQELECRVGMLAFMEGLEGFDFTGRGEFVDRSEDIGVLEECFGEVLFTPVGRTG